MGGGREEAMLASARDVWEDHKKNKNKKKEREKRFQRCVEFRKKGS